MTDQWQSVKSLSGFDRWVLGEDEPRPRVSIIVGDSDGNGRVAMWGYSTLDEFKWNFGGSCVHELERGKELAALVRQAILERPTSPSGTWDSLPPWYGRPCFGANVGDFTLSVDSSEVVIAGGHTRHVHDGYTLEPGETRADLWRFVVEIHRPGRRGTPWSMRSWSAFRRVETAQAHAEQIAAALDRHGFSLAEVVGSFR